MSLTVNENTLLQGDALSPGSTDVIVQRGSLPVGEPVPEGWRVLSGNSYGSTVYRVAYRYEIEDGEPVATLPRYVLHQDGEGGWTVFDSVGFHTVECFSTHDAAARHAADLNAPQPSYFVKQGERGRWLVVQRRYAITVDRFLTPEAAQSRADALNALEA